MSESGRVLAVDYGEKRIGLALSDPLRIIAKPLCVLPNQGYDQLRSELESIIAEHAVSLVIFGIPYAIDGGDTSKTLECKAVLEKLSQNLNTDIIAVDERYSTSEADTELKKLGYSWQEARTVIDAMAACMFLKEYLASQS